MNTPRVSTRSGGEESASLFQEMKCGGTVSDPEHPVVAARRKVGLTQDEFARILGITVRTLQGWEQSP